MGWTIAPDDMLPTAWIIDKDHLWEQGDDPQKDEAGTAGPSDAPQELMDRLALDTKAGVQFRIFDDDGILNYSGRILALDEDGREQTFLNGRCGEEFFRPLWDFGTPNAGATEIRYRDDTGKWVGL